MSRSGRNPASAAISAAWSGVIPPFLRYARFIAAKTGVGQSIGADERSPARVIIDVDSFRVVVTGFHPAAVGGMKTPAPTIRRRR